MHDGETITTVSKLNTTLLIETIIKIELNMNIAKMRMKY